MLGNTERGKETQWIGRGHSLFFRVSRYTVDFAPFLHFSIFLLPKFDQSWSFIHTKPYWAQFGTSNVASLLIFTRDVPIPVFGNIWSMLYAFRHWGLNKMIFSRHFQTLFLKQTFYPSALRAGGVLSSRSGRAGGRAGGWVGGRAGGCQTCGTHISVTS